MKKKEALKWFLAGANISAEGYNAEYGFHRKTPPEEKFEQKWQSDEKVNPRRWKDD